MPKAQLQARIVWIFGVDSRFTAEGAVILNNPLRAGVVAGPPFTIDHRS